MITGYWQWNLFKHNYYLLVYRRNDLAKTPNFISFSQNFITGNFWIEVILFLHVFFYESHIQNSFGINTKCLKHCISNCKKNSICVFHSWSTPISDNVELSLSHDNRISIYHKRDSSVTALENIVQYFIEWKVDKKPNSKIFRDSIGFL